MFTSHDQYGKCCFILENSETTFFFLLIFFHDGFLALHPFFLQIAIFFSFTNQIITSHFFAADQCSKFLKLIAQLLSNKVHHIPITNPHLFFCKFLLPTI